MTRPSWADHGPLAGDRSAATQASIARAVAGRAVPPKSLADSLSLLHYYWSMTSSAVLTCDPAGGWGDGRGEVN